MENTLGHQERSSRGGAKRIKSSLARQVLLDELGNYGKLIFEHLFFLSALHYTAGSSVRIPTPL